MLLSDIEVRFSLNPRTKTQPKDIQEHVLDKFDALFSEHELDIHDGGKHSGSWTASSASLLCCSF